MPKKGRARTRENKKRRIMEERLERKNLFGATDLTPFNAVQVMSGKEIKYR
jgi:hypothetical protein